MGAAGPLSLRGRARSPGDRPARLRGGRENLLLRRVDWRFLLHATHAPTVLDLARGRLAEALPLVGELTASAPADLVVVSRPTRRKLARARAALQVGGELYCEWRLPRPAGIWRARRTLRRAGFVDIRIHWPGPWPAMAAPHFWLSLDCDPAIEHLLRAASRPGPWAGAARLLWRLALRTGLLAPLCVVARRGPLAPADPGEREHQQGDRHPLRRVVACAPRPAAGPRLPHRPGEVRAGERGRGRAAPRGARAARPRGRAPRSPGCAAGAGNRSAGRSPGPRPDRGAGPAADGPPVRREPARGDRRRHPLAAQARGRGGATAPFGLVAASGRVSPAPV